MFRRMGKEKKKIVDEDYSSTSSEDENEGKENQEDEGSRNQDQEKVSPSSTHGLFDDESTTGSSTQAPRKETAGLKTPIGFNRGILTAVSACTSAGPCMEAMKRSGAARSIPFHQMPPTIFNFIKDMKNEWTRDSIDEKLKTFG